MEFNWAMTVIQCNAVATSPDYPFSSVPRVQNQLQVLEIVTANANTVSYVVGSFNPPAPIMDNLPF